MARALQPPSYVGVMLPRETYPTHAAQLRDALRSSLSFVMNPRNVVVKRGQFDIEIGLDSARSMDFNADIAYWLSEVEDIVADAGLDTETGLGAGAKFVANSPS